MSALLYIKIFVRKRETLYSIIVVALLVAVLASVTSVVNYLNSQVELLASLSGYSDRLVIVNGSSISDSKLNIELLKQLLSLQSLDNLVIGRCAWLKASFNSTLIEVPVRGVYDVHSLLKVKRAQLNGSIAKGVSEALIGELLANAYSIGVGSEIDLTYGTRSIKVTVVGVFRSQTEVDSELVVPMETIFNLTDERWASFIEFSVKRGVNVEEALAEVLKVLPEGVRLMQASQPATFARQVNAQTISFLSFWSLAVHAVIVSASYVAASELVRESRYEISLLKALGAGRKRLFVFVLLYMIVVSALSSIIGISTGLVGTQVVSAFISWVTPSMRVEPFIELHQAMWISITVSLSTVVGCLYPAYKASGVKQAEGL